MTNLAAIHVRITDPIHIAECPPEPGSRWRLHLAGTDSSADYEILRCRRDGTVSVAQVGPDEWPPEQGMEAELIRQGTTRNRAVYAVDVDTLADALDLPAEVDVRGFHTTDGRTLQVHLAHPALPEVPEMCEAPRLTLEEIQQVVS